MNVLIIGGGASGMAAALTAARQGHQVVLAERQARVGRKLLSTGNGRCNLTNEYALPDRYHGEEPDFCRFALEDPELSAAGTLDFFRQLGLVTVTEPGGRVYPLSNAASSVLDVLRFALEQQENIRVRTGCVIRQLKHRDGQFQARTEEGDVITARRCILAAGGAAGAKLGGGMDGYQLARQLGHHRTVLYPSLVQVCTDPTYPRGLKGVKAQAALTLTREGETLTAGQGEVLFTEYGVSGPAVFDLSRAVAAGGDGLTLHLDFLPGWSREDTLTWLERQRQVLSRQEAGALLTGGWRPCAARCGSLPCPSPAPAALTRPRSPPGACAPGNLTPGPWKAAWCRGSTPAARCWISTATAEASTCSGPGPPVGWRDGCYIFNKEGGCAYETGSPVGPSVSVRH